MADIPIEQKLIQLIQAITDADQSNPNINESIQAATLELLSILNDSLLGPLFFIAQNNDLNIKYRRYSLSLILKILLQIQNRLEEDPTKDVSGPQAAQILDPFKGVVIGLLHVPELTKYDAVFDVFEAFSTIISEYSQWEGLQEIIRSLYEYDLRIGLLSLSKTTTIFYNAECYQFLTEAFQAFHTHIMNENPQIRSAAIDFLQSLSFEDIDFVIVNTIDFKQFLLQWLEWSIKSTEQLDLIKSVDFIFDFIYRATEFQMDDDDDPKVYENYLPFYNMISQVISSSEMPLVTRTNAALAFEIISTAFYSFFEENLVPLLTTICELSALSGANDPMMEDWKFPTTIYDELKFVDHGILYDTCVSILQSSLSSDQFHIQAGLLLFSSMCPFFHDRITNEPGLFLTIVQSGLQSDVPNIYELALSLIDTMIYASPQIFESHIDGILSVLLAHIPQFESKTITTLRWILESTTTVPTHLAELVQCLLQTLGSSENQFKDDILDIISTALDLVPSVDESYGQMIGGLVSLEPLFLRQVFGCYGSLARVSPQSISPIVPRVMKQIIEAAGNEEILSSIPKPIQCFDQIFSEAMTQFLPNIFPLLDSIIKKPIPDANSVELAQNGNPLKMISNDDEEDENKRKEKIEMEAVQAKCAAIECLSVLLANHAETEIEFLKAQVELFKINFKDASQTIQNHSVLSFMRLIPILKRINYDPKEIIAASLQQISLKSAIEEISSDNRIISFTTLILKIINLYPPEIIQGTFENFVQFFDALFNPDNKAISNRLISSISDGILTRLFTLFNRFIEISGKFIFQTDSPFNPVMNNILGNLIKIITKTKSKLFKALISWSLSVSSNFLASEELLQISLMSSLSIINEKENYLPKKFSFRALASLLDPFPNNVIQNFDNFKDTLINSMASGSHSLLTAGALLYLKIIFMKHELLTIPLPGLLEKLMTIPITNESIYQEDSLILFQFAMKIMSKELGQDVPENALPFAKKMAIKVLLDQTWIYNKIVDTDLLNLMNHILIELGENPQDQIMAFVNNKESDMKKILRRLKIQ